MITLILPVAGESSRFPNTRPKFLLTHPSGNSILTEAIRGINFKNINKIVIIGLKEHQDRYNYAEELEKELETEYGIGDKVTLLLLKNKTKNQPETIVNGIKSLKIKGQILIKDCDNYFKVDATKGNFVGTYNLNKMSVVNAGNKSYIQFGKNGEIVNIVEKRIISNEFCCGMYGFEKASDFVDTYYKLLDYDNLYVSHIIYQLILKGKRFFAQETQDYLDWGTLEDWKEFTSQYTTLFIDIDGVLVSNSGKLCNPKWGSTEGITKNIEIVNKLYDSGKHHIVLTTSRTYHYEDVTRDQLKKAGLKNWHIMVMGLPHCKRILVNDYSNTNSYPSASAINIKRNSEDLGEMLK